MIQLTDKIAVTADENQYIVGRPRQKTDENGKETVRINNPCYYTTLAAAVKSVVAQAMRDNVADGSITTLRDFLTEQRRLQAEFTKLLEPLET